MSRIHEALKRAQQEKEAGHSALQAEEVVGRGGTASAVETEAMPPKIPESAPDRPAKDAHEPRSQSLRFEDLLAKCAKPAWKPDAKMLVFCDPNPFAKGAEQFRTLRSRLLRVRENQELKTLLVTSSIPAEGKTFIAANLAQAIARQPGTRILLIDADLRSPRLYTMLGAPDGPGLADYLHGGASETDVIQIGPGGGLCFVPAGNHASHASELISSDAMKTFLERVKPLFDWIIIDSPPAVSVADAAVVGAMCDGVLFVVRANSTPSDVAQRAARELAGTQIIGVVLNGANDSATYGSYYGSAAYGLPTELSSKR